MQIGGAFATQLAGVSETADVNITVRLAGVAVPCSSSTYATYQFVVSDGFNVRVANLLGCPVSASVTNYGAGGYVQATTTITATA